MEEWRKVLLLPRSICYRELHFTNYFRSSLAKDVR